MRYWLDLGVDALRVDAIPYLVEREGTNCENLPETHMVIKKLRQEIDAGFENRMILAEANQWPTDVRPYFGEGDECHMAFHFPLMPRIYVALRQEDRLPITDIMAQTPEIPETCQWLHSADVRPGFARPTIHPALRARVRARERVRLRERRLDLRCHRGTYLSDRPAPGLEVPLNAIPCKRCSAVPNCSPRMTRGISASR